jgi:hypothetical protein
MAWEGKENGSVIVDGDGDLANVTILGGGNVSGEVRLVTVQPHSLN